MPTPEPTIAAMAAYAVVLKAQGHGVSPEALCAKVGLDPTAINDIDGRVPASTMVALWSEVAPLDPDFGLHLAEMALSQPALPWHMVRASKTLGDGIKRLVGAWRVFNDLHPPDLVIPTDGKDGVLRMRTQDTAYLVPRHAAEFAFAWFVIAARRATGVDVKVRRVSFEHAEPACTAEHARIFGCEVVFGADATAIHFPAEAMALPTKDGGDPELAELLSRHADALIAKLPPRDALTAEVRAAMTPLLAGGDVTIERVAVALNASPRSLQRRLQAEGTTFQRVLDDLRKEIARTYLRDPMRPIAEIALLLGFSDQTTFHRAFVRWTGQTPGEARRRQLP